MGTADEDSGSLDSDSDLVITFKGRLHWQSLMQKRMRDGGCAWIGRKIVGSTDRHLCKTYIPLFDVISRQAGRQTARQAGNQAGRQAGRQPGRQPDIQTTRQPDSQTARQIRGRLTGRYADKQTDRRTNEEKTRQA